MAKPDYSKLEGVRVYTPVRISKQGMQNMNTIHSLFVMGAIDWKEARRRMEREFEIAKVEMEVEREYDAQQTRKYIDDGQGGLMISVDNLTPIQPMSSAEPIGYIDKRTGNYYPVTQEIPSQYEDALVGYEVLD